MIKFLYAHTYLQDAYCQRGTATFFNKVIMLFQLMLVMLIYIFPLLNILYILFGNTNLVNGRFWYLGWLHLLGFPLHLQNPHWSFANTRVFVLYIWIISLYWLTQSMLARVYESFCALYYFIMDCIIIFPSLNLISLSTFLFRTLLGYSGPEKQRLAHALIQR